MFRAIILPIFTSTRLCYSLWYDAPKMLPATGRQHRGCIIAQAVTQSSAREDGQNNCPKHVELTGIINKPLLLHLVVCLYYLYSIILFWDLLNNLNLTLILKTWRIWWAPNNACKYRWDLIRRLKVNVKYLKKFCSAASESFYFTGNERCVRDHSFGALMVPASVQGK